jgi:hypothetical protein
MARTLRAFGTPGTQRSDAVNNQTPSSRRAAAELDQVDQAVDMTFPASDPVALQITPSMVPAATPEPERGVWARLRRAISRK